MVVFATRLSWWDLSGLRGGARIPIITMTTQKKPTRDELKAFSAALGTSGAAPMFHLLGVTPEANFSMTAGVSEKILVTRADMANAWRMLDSGFRNTSVQAGSCAGRQHQSEDTSPRDEVVHLVALGNPHLSPQELARLAEYTKKGIKHPRTRIIATLGRDVLKNAHRKNLEHLKRFGVELVTDTCWCFPSILQAYADSCKASERVPPGSDMTVMTNSAKYAHYARGLAEAESQGKTLRVRFGGLEACVEAARTSRAPKPPAWVGEEETGDSGWREREIVEPKKLESEEGVVVGPVRCCGGIKGSSSSLDW